MKLNSTKFALGLAAVLSCFNLGAQDSANITSLYHWTTEGMEPSTAWGNVYNEVWGYAADGREYAIIGTSGGTHFIDITDPAMSEEVDFVEGSQTGAVVVHRDYHNMDNFLYMVCQEGDSKLKIADLSYLPDSVHLIYDSNEFLKGAHNIFIDTVQTRLYAMTVYKEGTSGMTGLQIYDIADPYQPELLDEIYANQDVHDMYVNNGLAYLNRGDAGMVVLDFFELPATFMGSITEYEGQGYNHSGYVTEDGAYYVMGDETHGSPVKIIDASDPSDLEVISTVTSGVHDLSICHNQIVHDDILYAAYYYDGLYTWNIEDPSNPYLLGYYDTSTVPHRSSFEGAWGVYPFLPSGNILVSDMQTGLWVLKMDETAGVGDRLDSKSVQVWPNPCQEVLHINLDADYSLVSIFDIQGKMVASQSMKSTVTSSVDTSMLLPGVYTIKVEGEEGFAVSKFVKK